jgi:geranylgeranyl pyrophosphate synthase
MGAMRVDARLGRALTEVLAKGRVPLPDRILGASEGPPPVGGAWVWHKECRVVPSTEGVRVECQGQGSSFSLFFSGASEELAGRPGGVLCSSVSGQVVVGGSAFEVGGGSHTAAGVIRVSPGLDALVSRSEPSYQATVVLNDGSVVVQGGAREAWVHSPSSTASPPSALHSTLQPSLAPHPWVSTQTFTSYPTSFTLDAPSLPNGAPLALVGEAEASECVSLLACPGVWMGRVRVTGGGSGGGDVVGHGIVVVSMGAGGLASLDTFFRSVGIETRAAVHREYPLPHLSPSKVVDFVATSSAHPWHAKGVDERQLSASLVAPVRHLVDAGGKSWRSYGILAACDAVGGSSHKHRHFLALAELLHVGSLIVDDLQDESPLRRGKRSVHLEFSPAVAINAGTAAYFYCERIITREAASRPPRDTLRLFEQYFGCMRAGHGGQGLDIAGLEYMMEEALGNPVRGAEVAEERLLAVHMLKTGVPAASLLRMGAVLGGGSDAAVMAVGRYYEAVGCAFQIMDDVRNLRGVFSGKADKSGAGVELKVLGEDITAGKVTFPVVKALRLLPAGEMREVWEVIKTKPKDRGVVDGVIAKLEACGAIDECVTHATRLVEEGFKWVDGELEDSIWKCFLKAFGHYLVEI